MAAAGLTPCASLAACHVAPQAPASRLAPCQARAGGQLGWSRAAWQPCQTEPILTAPGARRVSVHSRKPSQAAIDRMPEILEFLKALGFEEEEAVQIMKRGRLAFSLVSTLEGRVAALESLGFSKEELNVLIISNPKMVGCSSPGTIRASVGNLQDLFGFTPSQVKGALLKEPHSISNSDCLREAVQYLRGLGLSQATVGQIFLRNPRSLHYLSGHTEELEALRELGFSKQELAAAIEKFPNMLGDKVARNYRQLVKAMDEQFGVDADTCRRLVLAHPQHVSLKTATVVQKVDYIVKVMGREVHELLRFPSYVGCSLERRIRPRYEACVKNGMENLSLGTILAPGNAAFDERMQRKKERLRAIKPTSEPRTLKAS